MLSTRYGYSHDMPAILCCCSEPTKHSITLGPTFVQKMRNEREERTRHMSPKEREEFDRAQLQLNQEAQANINRWNILNPPMGPAYTINLNGVNNITSSQMKTNIM